MNMEEASKILRGLSSGQRQVMYSGSDGTIVSATRTDKVCPHDFAVGLQHVGRVEFYPTHIRLLFDLYLKNLSNVKDAHSLFVAIEGICDGNDPEPLVSELLKLSFPMKLDSPDVNLFYTQLLMIEQEFNYGPNGCKKGYVNPPREFLMRFIRWVASGDTEIDKIIFNAVRNFPPPVKYAKRIQSNNLMNLLGTK